MSDLFDAGFFARLNNIKLAMHMRLEQGQTGGRKSSAKGSSVEFSDFREYLPGDDIRRIDWNVYGRLDKLYVKQFMEEKEAYYHIFLDTSASMNYGQKKKSTMALRLAAIFAWLVQKQLDRVELLTFRDGKLSKTSPVNGRNSFGNLLRELEQVKFEGTTQINEAIRRGRYNGRGVCIIISDFLDPEGIDEAIKFLTFKKQEVFLVQVLAREELEYNQEGTLALTDMETGEQLRITMTRQTVMAYKKTLEAHNKGLNSLAKRYGCNYLRVCSDEDLDQVVFETLRKKGIFG